MRPSVRILFGLLTVFAIRPATSAAPAPRLIPFQFHLASSSGTPINQPVSVRFSLYEAPDAATSAWTESKALTPENGRAFTLLGDATPFSVAVPPIRFDRLYYLGVKVGNDAEMTPRMPLGAAPYALALPNVTVDPTTGFVGIGVPAPTAPLHVAGDVKLGQSADRYAASGVENLRLLRGMVRSNGTVQLGSGYSVERVAAGKYQIAFDQSFGNNPSVVATPASYSYVIAVVELVGSHSCTVQIYNSSGTKVDSSFHFIAVG